MIGIYKIENTITKKVYIGSSKNIEARFGHYRYLLPRNKCHSPKLQNAYNKYGKAALEFSVIELCDEEQLRDKEHYWIIFYDCVKNGYNCSDDTTCATRGLKVSAATKEKMSIRQRILMSDPERKKASGETLSAYNRSQKGVPKSELHKAKISRSNTGKKANASTLQKQSERLKENPINYWLGKKMPETMREKFRKNMTGKSGSLSPKAKKIDQVDCENNIIESFHGAAEASRITGIGRSAIKNCLTGLSKTAGGYKWQYNVSDQL